MLGAILLSLMPSVLAQDDCVEAAKYIYVLTSDRGLHRFNPMNESFQRVGTLDCPGAGNNRPYSMAVARNGTAFVVYEYGKLYQVNTRNAACTATNFTSGQHGFTSFGMGFTLSADGQDELYISSNQIGGVGYLLGRIDLQTMTVHPIGPYDRVTGRAELSGDAKGGLYGAFESSPFRIAEINPANASIGWVEPIDSANFQNANFAFAGWGGSFYLFAGQGTSSDIYRYDPEQSSTQRISQTSLVIVGAGVSTCAPTEMPTEDLNAPGDNGGVPPPNDAGNPPAPPQPAMEELSIVIMPPPPGPHAPGETLTLVAGVRDADGELRPLEGGTFHITDDSGVVTNVSGQPRSDGQITAEIHLPDTEGDVTITFTPEIQLTPQEQLQPETDSALPLNLRFQLRWDISDFPAVCYVGRECTGTALLVRDGPNADRITQAPQARYSLQENGENVTTDPFTRDPTQGRLYSRMYTEPQTVTWQMIAQATTGQVLSEPHTIEVRVPIELQVNGTLDFGTIRAGTAPQQTCTEVDLSGSSGLEGATLQLDPVGMDGTCMSTLTILQDDVRTPLEPGVTITGGAFSLCLEVPYCSADQSPDGAGVSIAATDPAFQDQQGTLPVLWEVTARSWLSCNVFWFGPLVGTLVALFIAIGFIRPQRFPVGAHIATAGSLKGLKRASPVELRAVRGGNSGFYRDARLGIHVDGAVNGRTRGAIAILRATRRGVRLEVKGALEVYEKRRRQWRTPERQGLQELNPSDVYRIGELYFQVEPG